MGSKDHTASGPGFLEREPEPLLPPRPLRVPLLLAPSPACTPPPALQQTRAHTPWSVSLPLAFAHGHPLPDCLGQGAPRPPASQ